MYVCMYVEYLERDENERSRRREENPEKEEKGSIVLRPSLIAYSIIE